MRVTVASTLVALAVALGTAAAQTAAPPAAGPAKPATAQAQPGAPAPQAAPAKPAESYSYSPEGRRDPFISLIGSGAEPRVSGARKGEGPAGMLLNEISVRGVVQSRGALVAMVEGPDKKTYIVHAGDKLADGSIRAITPQGLVVIQEVNDPLSLVKQREVRKLLRSLEEAKQ